MIFALLMEDYKMEAIIGRAAEKMTLAEMLVSEKITDILLDVEDTFTGRIDNRLFSHATQNPSGKI